MTGGASVGAGSAGFKSPDVRARSLAALIEAGAMTRAADKPHSAANTTVGRHGAVAAGGGPDVR